MLNLVRISALLVLLSSACASYRIRLKSVPDGAQVAMLNQTTGKYESLGKTPLTVDRNKTLSAGMKKTDLLSLAIEKDGFVTEHYVVDLGSNPSVELTTELKPLTNLDSVFQQKTNKTAEEIGQKIHRVYRLLNDNAMTEAYGEAVKLTESYPRSALFWDIRGSLEVLAQRNDAAITSYKMSLSLNPDNPETTDALRKLMRGAQ